MRPILAILAIVAAPNRATCSPASKTFYSVVLLLLIVRLVIRLSLVARPFAMLVRLLVIRVPKTLVTHLIRAMSTLVLRVEMGSSLAVSACSIVTFVVPLRVTLVVVLLHVTPVVAQMRVIPRVDRRPVVPVVGMIAVVPDRWPRS